MRIAVILFSIILGGCQDKASSNSNRFGVETVDGSALLLDRRTGETWILVSTRIEQGKTPTIGVVISDTEVQSWEKIPTSDGSKIGDSK